MIAPVIIGWTITSLENLVEILDSKRVPLNRIEREVRIAAKPIDNLFPYYGATGLVGLIDDYLFSEPLILLGEDGVPFFDPLKPKAYMVEGKFWVNNHAHVLRNIESAVDSRYLTAYLNAFDYTKFVSGSTRLKLTQAAMKDIPIILAPRAEQKRIADKLDTVLARVDSCREHLDRIPAILKRFRQSVLAAAITGHLNTHMGFPEQLINSTRSVGLSETLTEILTGPFGSALHKSDYRIDGIPIVNPMHINGGVITHSSEMTVSIKKARELEKFKLREGDVIVARRGVMGRCAVVTTEQSGWLCGTGSLVLRPSSVLDPRYLQLFLSSPNTVSILEKDAVGSTMVNLNQRILLSLSIQLPTLEVQNTIVKCVESLFIYADRLESRYNEARTKIDRLTPALLGKAFRGELVPQDPNDEPASVLLERIRAARAAEPVKGRQRKMGGRAKKIPKSEVIMLQLNEIKETHLTAILKERGPLTAEALWSASQLDIDDFYDQLKVEEEQGLLQEQRSDVPDSPRLLEAAA